MFCIALATVCFSKTFHPAILSLARFQLCHCCIMSHFVFAPLGTESKGLLGRRQHATFAQYTFPMYMSPTARCRHTDGIHQDLYPHSDTFSQSCKNTEPCLMRMHFKVCPCVCELAQEVTASQANIAWPMCLSIQEATTGTLRAPPESCNAHAPRVQRLDRGPPCCAERAQ